MSKASEHREFSRSNVIVRSELRLPSGVLVEGRTRDLSLEGILLQTDKYLPVGNAVRMALVLESGQGEFRIETEGHVVRITDDGVAIQFTKLDAESLEHLKRLVLYNADDADKVDLEFEQHIGIKRKADPSKT